VPNTLRSQISICSLVLSALKAPLSKPVGFGGRFGGKESITALYSIREAVIQSHPKDKRKKKRLKKPKTIL